MKKTIIALGVMLGSVVSTSYAFPDQAMTIVVPYAAGGSSDTVARAAGKYISAETKQNVVVDNKPGGATVIGSQAVLGKPADGYTTLLVAASFIINPHLIKLPFDVDKDFKPVALLASNPHVLVVNSNVPANTLPEFIEWAKGQQQEPTFSSFGNGSSGHIGFEMFKQLANINMLHVPYKGAAPSTLAVVSGEVNATLGDIGILAPHIQANKVKAIAITGEERAPLLPNVPTFKESGIEDFSSQTWLGLWVRAETPEDRIQKLNELFNQAMQTEEMKELLSQQGLQARPTTPTEFTEFVNSESQRYKTAIEKANIRIE